MIFLILVSCYTDHSLASDINAWGASVRFLFRAFGAAAYGRLGSEDDLAARHCQISRRSGFRRFDGQNAATGIACYVKFEVLSRQFKWQFCQMLL